MIINHNVPAINAHRQMTINNSAISKSLEKLSSGLGINRAADNAAGLAISEKMRGQISGLDQASANAQDGISLIQTAEGALNETHSILQRMRQLSVQSANGTYQDDVDRENIQKEVDALKTEIDRISTSTHYNNIKLLDGSLTDTGSAASALGPKFSAVSTADTTGLGIAKGGAMVTADKLGASVSVATSASVEAGHESAVWDAAGTTLTITLATSTTYSQDRLNEIIKNADQEESTATANPASVKITLQGQGPSSSFTTTGTATAAVSLGTTVAGKKATVTSTALVAGTDCIGANNIKLTAKKYGQDMNDTITIAFDADGTSGKNEGDVTEATKSKMTDGAYTAGKYTIHLRSNKEYSEDDIKSLLAEKGLDYDVELQGPDAAEDTGKETIKVIDSSKKFDCVLAGGTGWSADDVDDLKVGDLKKSTASGDKDGGLVFQIGANGTKDQRVSLNVADMSCKGIGISDISCSTRSGANDAIDTIDKAINTVSGTRADLGALQNRMEHTINSLGVASENLTAAESRIRDVDMAKEMMAFTKNQILSQASQAMLAQANALPQGVLQLLQ